MPRSIRLLFRDRWTDGIVSASSEAGDYESDKTQTYDLSSHWRSTESSSPYIVCDLGTQYRIGALAVVGTNLTQNATVRARVSNSSSFATSLYDSGATNRSRYFSENEVIAARTSEFFLNGVPYSGYEKRFQRQIPLFILPTEVTGQYIRFDFADPTNPDGYIKVGYIYSGISYEPSRDLMFNWKIQRDNVVRNGQASSGQYWSASVFNKTLVSFTLAPQTEPTLLGDWMLFQHLVSISKTLIVQLVDFTDSLRYTTTIYGRLTESVGAQKIGYSAFNLNFTLEEVID